MLILTSAIAFAQKQTGSIEGIVRDLEDRPIPGATVTVSSPSLIGGTATTFTAQDGEYRFPALSPGMYEVTAELQGFQTLIRANIDLSLGSTLSVDFTLQMTNISETVEVEDKPPLIDATTTAVSFHVPPEVIHNLPNFQNIESLLKLTPGVGDDLVAFGADGRYANRIWIDGVNPLANYNYNWLEAVQVTGIGAPAEYGGFTGVVANFITRSGGNQFHGLLETFFQNQNLSSSNVPDPGPESPFKTYDLSAQLGGPILRDRLWFFAGLQFPHTEIQPLKYNGLTTTQEQKWITKLTYKRNQNNTLQGFVNWNQGSIDGGGASEFVLPEATTDGENQQFSWNATWISLFTSNTTFEGRFGGLYTHTYDIEDRPDLPGHSDRGDETYSVNAISRGNHEHTSYQMNLALSHHADDFIYGGHDFRFGVEFERTNGLNQTFTNGGMYYIDGWGEPYLRVIQEGYNLANTNHRVSGYAQDDWNVSDRIKISLGVRWDHNVGNTDRGEVFRTNAIAPRIGLIWNLDQDSQTVVKVHLGDYFDGLSDRQYFFLSDHYRSGTLYQYYRSGRWNDATLFREDYVADQDLKQPRVRQFSIGFDRVMPGEVPFGVHYIYRSWSDVLEDVGISEYKLVPAIRSPFTGEIISVYQHVGDVYQYLLTNPPELYRRYHGLEFFANRQFGSRLYLSGSVVFSKLRGNYPGNSGFGGANTPFMDSPNSLINFPGRLTNDPTLAWKFVGTVALPGGVNSGWYLRHESGDTWAARASAPLPNFEAPVIFLEPAGSRRLPGQTLLDIRFEKQFALLNGQFRITVDAFNVFNSAYVQRVKDRLDIEEFGEPLWFNDPRTIRLGARYTF